MDEESAAPILEDEADVDLDKADKRKVACCRLGPSPYPIFVATAFYFIQVAINVVAFEAVLYNKFCFIQFKNLSLCMNSTFTESHPAIEQETLTWGTYSSLAQLPLSILTTLVLSSYCDMVGHKLPFLLSTVGAFLATGYLAILATPEFLGWPVASIFGYSILGSIFGNYSLVLMSGYSYVALITSRKNVAVFMAIAESSIQIGMLIGNSINGPITDSTSLTTLIYINVGISLMPAIVVSLFVTDVTHTSVNYTWKDVVGVTHLLDTFRCVYKKREGYNRLLLHLSFAAYGFIFTANVGVVSCFFLYYVKQQGMSMTEYSLFSAFLTTLESFGGPGVLILLKKFTNLSRNTIIVLSCCSVCLEYIIVSITAIPGSAWIGGVFVFAITIIYGEIRSLQTSLCTKDELGQMFAFDSLLQLLLGVGATVVFKTIYSSTLNVYPEAFLSFAALLVVLAMVVVVCIDRIQAMNFLLEIFSRKSQEIRFSE